MTHPTEFALRLVKQGFLQARRLPAIGFLTIIAPFCLYVCQNGLLLVVVASAPAYHDDGIMIACYLR